MNANELRIGNIVYKAYANGSNKNEYSIKPHDFVDFEKGLFIYEPIPLTEEWLQKFGFEYKKFTVPDEDGVYRDKKEPNKEYFCHCKLPNEISYYLPYYYFNYHIGSVTVKYVHTLQNLIFALTGNELQIK